MWIKKGGGCLPGALAHPGGVNVIGYIAPDGTLSVKTFQGDLNAPLLISIMGGHPVGDAITPPGWASGP